MWSLVNSVAEHGRGKIFHIVSACHYLAICAGASYRHQVAPYAERKKSSRTPYVTGFADRTHYVIGLESREELPL